MTNNSNSDLIHDSDGPENLDRTWSEMAVKAMNCPGITVLDRWMDDSLEELEKEFANFATQTSKRLKLGR